jgi:hypothetical protein
LLQQFSKRSEQIDDWLTAQGLAGIKASSAAAVARDSGESLTASLTAEQAKQAVQAADPG